MRTETKWAVIASLAIFIWLFIEKILGLQTEEKHATWLLVSTLVSLLIFIIVYFMVCREKREHDLGGVMSYKQGFWAAAITTLVFIPLSMLGIYIFAHWGNPDFAALVAQKQGGADYGKTTMNFWLAGHLYHALLGGLFFSLLFPLFTKRSAV